MLAVHLATLAGLAVVLTGLAFLTVLASGLAGLAILASGLARLAILAHRFTSGGHFDYLYLYVRFFLRFVGVVYLNAL